MRLVHTDVATWLEVGTVRVGFLFDEGTVYVGGGCRRVSVALGWGWDSDHPLSVRPRRTATVPDAGRTSHHVSWLGFRLGWMWGTP